MSHPGANAAGQRNPAARPLSGPLLLGWVVTAVLLVYLLLIGGGWSGIYVSALRVISLLLIVIGLVVWTVLVVRQRLPFVPSQLWPAFAAAIAAMLISTLASDAPRLGAEYLGYAVILSTLYFVLVTLSAVPGLRARLGVFACLACASINVLYIGLSIGYWIEWWTLVGRLSTPPLRPAFLSLTYGNPSAVMTLSLLFLTASVAHLGFQTRSRRLAVVALTLSTLLVVLLSGSRAGWLAAGLAFVVTCGAALLRDDVRSVIASRVRSRLALLVGIVVIVAGTVAGAILAPGILMRAGAGGEALRAAYNAASIRMIQDSPIVGQGPGTWAMRRIQFTQAPESDYYIPHAHNIYLQTAAEIGVVGLAAGLLVALLLGRLIWNGLRDPHHDRRRYAWATLFSVTYFAAHQLLDFYPNMPAVLFAFALPIAWLDATASRPTSERTSSGTLRSVALGGLSVITLVALGGLLYQERSALAHDQAVAYANRDEWQEALPLAREAVRLDPDVPSYQFTLALAEAWTGNEHAAEAALDRVTNTDQMPVAWLDLARLRLDRGDRGGAADALANAMRLGSQQPTVAVNAALMWQELGDRARATSALTDALMRAPTLAGDAFWQEDTKRNPLMFEAASEVSRRDPYVAFQVALAVDDLEAARRHARTAGLDQDLAERVIRAWDDQGAVEDIYQLPRERPLTAAVEWAITIASRYDDKDALERFRRWAVIIEGPIGNSPGVVRTTMQQEPGRALVDETAFYGQYTYRRAIPWDHLLPGMARIVR
jgi:O-antigen ligase